MQRKDKK